jgi:uncharacterized membrane protein
MNSRKLHAWLHEATHDWVRLGLVSEQQAQAIRDRHPTAANAPAWGTIVFSSLGAVIAGLGIILLFAYNWEAIPRVAKLALVLGVLAATHATGLALSSGAPRRRNLGIGVSLLATMLFGAGIWVVAQIYHIDEHYPNGFLVWSLGALAMAWAQPSVPQGILAAVLIAAWAGTERFGFTTPVPLAPVLVGTALGILAYRIRSRTLLAVVLLAFLVAYLFVAPRATDVWPYLTALLGLASLYAALSRLARRLGGFPTASPILGFYGWAAGLVTLFVLSFPDMAKEVLRHSRSLADWRGWVWWALPLVAGTAAWSVVLWSDRRRHIESASASVAGFADYLLPLSAILCSADGFFLSGADGWVVAAPFGLALLALAAGLIARGCRQAELRPTVLGSLLLSALALARYFDLFESLLARGAVFIVLGVVLFGQGILYSRARKRRMEARPT